MFEEIKDLILDQLDVEPKEVTLDKKIVEDFGADSLDLIELSDAISIKYGIEFNKEDIKKIKTVKDLVNIVEEKTK